MITLCVMFKRVNYVELKHFQVTGANPRAEAHYLPAPTQATRIQALYKPAGKS